MGCFMIIRTANVNNQVTNLLPSVTATTNAETVSTRYKHIQTSDVLDALTGQGFNLVTQQGKRAEHSKHGLLLVNKSIGFLDDSGSENYATVSLFNSHDGKSAVTLVSGFFRQICSNGLISGNANEWLKIRHSERGFNLIGSTVEQLPIKIAAFRDFIVNAQNTNLTPEQITELANRVFDTIKPIRPVNAADNLIVYRRAEDVRSDMWTIANIIQENAVKGGMQSANSNRRLRGLNRLNSQNRVTGLIMSTVSDYMTELNAA